MPPAGPAPPSAAELQAQVRSLEAANGELREALVRASVSGWDGALGSDSGEQGRGPLLRRLQNALHQFGLERPL